MTALWKIRVANVASVLKMFVYEHGAPNRFMASEVQFEAAIPLHAVYRVGRYMLHLVEVPGVSVTYEKGIFSVTPNA